MCQSLVDPIMQVSDQQVENMEWDERYSEPGYAYGTEPNDYLVSVCGSIPDGKVLSLAEGEGRNAVYLAEQGFAVTAIDSSRVGLEKANDLARDRGTSIETRVMDLAGFDPGFEQWDAVVSIFCHLPHAQRRVLYKKIVPSLKPGGVLVLEAYIPKQLEFATGGPPVAEMMPTLDMLRQELQGLSFEVAHEIERDVIEGKYHHGRAAVVQILARKT